MSETLTDGGAQPWMLDYEVAERDYSSRERSSLRIGISEVFYGENLRDLGFVRSTAQLLEELGYDTLWLMEHIVFFDDYASKYPYGSVGGNEIFRKRQEEGNPGLRGILDGPILSVAAAAVTSTLRFGTYVTILPQRNPVVFAREIATVDVLTGGRFNFGVGVGWSKEEYEACGVPFERRGARLDEYIAAMKELWTSEKSTYEGEFVSFKEVLAYPKPLQRPHPPILIGGQSQRGIRRAARSGDGLIVYNLELENIEKVLDLFDRYLVEEGRRIDDAYVLVGRRHEERSSTAWQKDAAFIEACRQFGVIDEVSVSPRFGDDNYEQQMRSYAETIGVGSR